MFFRFVMDLSKTVFQLSLLFSDSPLEYKKCICSVKRDLNFLFSEVANSIPVKASIPCRPFSYLI